MGKTVRSFTMKCLIESSEVAGRADFRPKSRSYYTNTSERNFLVDGYTKELSSFIIKKENVTKNDLFIFFSLGKRCRKLKEMFPNMRYSNLAWS